MEAITQVVSTINVTTELLCTVSMEIAMAIFAAILYFSMTGRLTACGKRRPFSKSGHYEPTLHQQEAKALQQSKIKSASDNTGNGNVGAGKADLWKALRVCGAATSAKTNNRGEKWLKQGEHSIWVGGLREGCSSAELKEAFTRLGVDTMSDVYAPPGKNFGFVRFRSATDAKTAMQLVSEGVSIRSEALQQSLNTRGLAESQLQESSRRPFSKSHQQVAKALQQGKIKSAIALFQDLPEVIAGSLPTKLTSCLLKAVAKSPDFDDVMAEMKALVEKVEICSLDAVVREAAKDSDVVMYNAIMDVCVECGSLERAMEYFSHARSSGLADAFSYRTGMKIYLAQGRIDAAKSLLPELLEKGLNSRPSYNCLVNFYVKSGKCDSGWKLVEEMQAAGVLPDAHTCALLLNGFNEGASKAAKASRQSRLQIHMDKISAVVDTISPITPLLFSELVRACICTGQPIMLQKNMSKFMKQGIAPTTRGYESMIKASGHLHDVARARKLWNDMVKHDIWPTASTLGHMVEVLMSNRCTDEALQLVKDMRSQESTRPLVNTFVYTKLFSSIAKDPKEVKDCISKLVSLYEEMKAEGFKAVIAMYNSILNCFAEAGFMEPVPELLEDMKKSSPPVEPNMISYSIMVKGYCKCGSLDRALAIFRDIQSEGNVTPHLGFFNCLMQECCETRRPSEALKLLDDMRSTDVTPSHFTISILVKLLGYCGRLDQAFSIIEEFTSCEYGIKINIKTYACLMCSCFKCEQPAKAVALHDQIMKEGVQPDEFTYTMLVHGCLQAGFVDQAVHLTKCAHGLATPKVKGMPPGINSRVKRELVSALGSSSAEAKSLLAELADCVVAGAKGRAKKNDGNPPYQRVA